MLTNFIENLYYLKGSLLHSDIVIVYLWKAKMYIYHIDSFFCW